MLMNHQIFLPVPIKTGKAMPVRKILLYVIVELAVDEDSERLKLGSAKAKFSRLITYKMSVDKEI